MKKYSYYGTIAVMDSSSQSRFFFMISSVGFVTLWVFVAVLLFYLIQATKSFSKLLKKIEKDIDTVGDVTKEMLEEVRDSTMFRFLFRKKKNPKLK